MKNFLLLWLFLSSSCFGQLIEITKEYTVIGLKEPRLVSGLILAKDTSNLQSFPVALVRIDTEAENIIVEASDVNRNDLTVMKIDPKTFVVNGNNRIWIEVTCVDFSKNIYLREKKAIDLSPPEPPTPPTPPKPDVSIPDDVFDNIAKRTSQWAKGLPSNQSVSKAYRDMSKELKSNPSITIDQASKKLTDSLNVVPEIGKYKDFFNNLNEDMKKRWPMAKGLLSEYWEMISIGLQSALTSPKSKLCPREDCMCQVGTLSYCECVTCNCGVK